MYRSRNPFLLGSIAFVTLVSCFFAALAIRRYFVWEAPLIHSARVQSERVRRQESEEQHQRDLDDRFRQLDATVRYIGKLNGDEPGVYIDLSQRPGAISDFECLGVLRRERRKPFFLSLQGTRISDSEIHHLFALQDLSYIDLSDTLVTETGVAALQKALPKLIVIRDSQRRMELGGTADTKWIQRLPRYIKAPADPKNATWQQVDFPNPNVNSRTPDKIDVLSGTSFVIFGKKCRLLGVMDSDDVVTRMYAKEFTQAWFASCGFRVRFYNASNPLKNPDGINIVWAGEPDSAQSLNENLVRAGLARKDYADWNDYEFVRADKNFFELWREKLDAAANDASEGLLPQVCFGWPPKIYLIPHLRFYVVSKDAPIRSGERILMQGYPGLMLSPEANVGQELQVKVGTAEATSLEEIPRGRIESKNVAPYATVFGDLSKRMAKQPADPAWQFGKSLVWQDILNHDNAIKELSSLIQKYPQDARYYIHRGDSWFQKAEYDKAIADYSKAIELDSRSSISLMKRGNALAQRGEYEKAIADYSNAIRLAPNDYRSFQRRGDAWKAMGKYDQAVSDYDEVVRIAPRSFGARDAYASLALVRAACPDSKYRDGALAVDMAKKSLASHPARNTLQYCALAAAYAEIGDFGRAIRAQESALLLAGKSEKAQLYQALHLYKAQKPYREESKAISPTKM